MAEEMGTLATFYENWRRYQNLLTSALAPLSREQLGLRAAPGVRSIEENTAHMIGARRGWFTQFLGEDWGDFPARGAWDFPGAPDHDATALVAGLEQSWVLMFKAFCRWNEADLQQQFERERGGQTYRMSRAWVIWHLIEHDVHHGGEISLTLGMNGLQAPDL